MAGLLASCDRLFGTQNLYEVLNIPTDSTSCEVKRGYHKLSLTVHPDKLGAERQEEATEKFQTLGKVYNILSDSEKRAVYDECGEVDCDEELDSGKDWLSYWRLLFSKVTVQDLAEFETKYRGSDDEKRDVRQAYLDHEGDFDLILDCIMCSSVDDESRFRDILSPLIDSGELPKFDKFTKNAKAKRIARKKQADKEAREVEAASMESLAVSIRQRQETRTQDMDGFFANLEAKYARPKRSAKENVGGTATKKGKTAAKKGKTATKSKKRK